ncbi:MAG TPA: protease inhibitor I42 family protein, partial [Methanomicrobiales archaeon]|nr:protease inhibitor I42 family protein [Methanomicrobiales archaeon]
NSGQVMGAGGTRSFTLAAAKAGSWNLTAEYRRPWVQAGTVTREDIEGGFYGIVSDNGTRYEPLDLDPKYQVDGLRVAFETTPAGDTASTRMWGTSVHLSLVEEIPRFILTVSVR